MLQKLNENSALRMFNQTKVMSDTALAKFLKIREKWDPKELFPNYKKFVKAHDKINRLQNKAQL